MTTMAILTDTTRCTGCEKCVAACRRVHALGPDRPGRWKSAITDLSDTRFTTIVHRGDQAVRLQCRHCLDPACVSACLVGAMQKMPLGPVVYDADRCMGCRYCMVACPFEIPRYEWAAPVPRVGKCDMCASRLVESLPPACVEACPHEATIFGDREALLAEAHRRIRASPGRYIDKVDGQSDVGGTSVLMISSIPLDFLVAGGSATSQALPELTWAALSKVPPLALGVGGLMTGLFWITRRRMQLQGRAEPPGARSGARLEDSEHVRPGHEEGRNR